MKRLIFVVCAALLTGCSSSPWKEHYAGVEPGAHAPPASVELREVPWSRAAAVLERIEANRAASALHVSEWPPERRAAEKGELLRALQITENPTTIRVLGRSVFRSTDSIRPDDPALERFARTLGADLVVYSAGYTGKADRVVREPTTVHRWGWRERRDFDGHWRESWEPGFETIFVPVVVRADEHAWVVYYLRRG